MQQGLEARVARLEGEVSHIVRRLDNLEHWMRVLIGLQVTAILANIAGLIAIIQLLT